MGWLPAVLAAGVALAAAREPLAPVKLGSAIIRTRQPNVAVWSKTRYHGWREAWRCQNDQVEVIVVPEIGRVMQFRFLDDTGPFWENRALDGRPPDRGSPAWRNFGGDKPWPAPQADGPKITARAWPPPAGFDACPMDADTKDNQLILISPLVWIGAAAALRIDSPRVQGAEYPDQGCSVELYTHPDPDANVELETLGPLRTLSVGESALSASVYTLSRRTCPDARTEAEKLLRASPP